MISRRPDSRLLLDRGFFRQLPSGSRCWRGSGSYMVEELDHLFGLGADGCFLDGSAPARLEDGTPERFDALPWLLEVFARRVGMPEAPIRLGNVWESGTLCLYGVGGHPLYSICGPYTGSLSRQVLRLEAWPELGGLRDADKPRAVFLFGLRHLFSSNP